MAAVILSVDADWAYGFYIQVVLLVPIALYIAVSKRGYLNLTEAVQGVEEEEPRPVSEADESTSSELAPGVQKSREATRLFN